MATLMEREPELFTIVQIFKDIWYLWHEAYDGPRMIQIIKGSIPAEYSDIEVIAKDPSKGQMTLEL